MSEKLSLVVDHGEPQEDVDVLSPEPKLPVMAIGGWNLRWGSWEVQGWDLVGETEAVLRLRMVGQPDRIATIPCSRQDIATLEGAIPELVYEKFDLTLTIAPSA